MMRALQKLLPAQVKGHTVVVKHTFLEVADVDADIDSVCRPPARRFTDSAVHGCRQPAFERPSLPGADFEEVDSGSSTGPEAPESPHRVEAASSGSSTASEPAADSSSAGRWCSKGGRSIADLRITDVPSGGADNDSTSLDGDADDDFEYSVCHLRTLSFSEEDQPSTISRMLTPPTPDGVPLAAGRIDPLASAREAKMQSAPQQPGFLAFYPVTMLVPPTPPPVLARTSSPSTAASATTAQSGATAATVDTPLLPSCPRQEAVDHGAVVGQKEAREQPWTTVMLRNIPNNYSRSRFLALLDSEGFAGQYDFVYLPVDFRTGAALGYAFVNMIEPGAVEKLWNAFEGFKRWGMPSRKRCSMSWSDPYQGFQANMEHYRNSPVMHCTVPDDHKPIVFAGGVRVQYPAPTKSIRAPRVRKYAD